MWCTPMSLNQQVLQSLRKLEILLEREFEALKSQDLDSFDQIQQQKAPILRFFSDSAFLAAGASGTSVHRRRRRLAHPIRPKTTPTR